MATERKRFSHKSVAFAPSVDKDEKKAATRPPKPAKAPAPAPPPDTVVEPIIAFYIFAAAHTVAALFSPIQDCDEVYNYYEPTHYLNHAYGLQTWEYSPEYAIRSWAYAGLHAIIVFASRLLPFAISKISQFYFLRIGFALACACCESRLFTKVSQTLSPRIGMLFMVVMVSSPGMFHASISYLPSSFAMYCTMLAMAAFLDWRGGLRTAQGIFCIGLGATLGWPFAAALVLPFLGEEVLFASMTGEYKGLFWRVVHGTVRTALVLATQIGIDSFMYKKFVVVPFNIVWYNVLAAAAGKGPNIYGTEPWHFYIRNLLINFNIWFILAVAALPLLLLQNFILGKPATKQSWLRTLTFLTPFYLWLAVFTVQPHKEERFMYPAYPALALNAAISLHILLINIGSSNSRSTIGMIPVQLKLTLVGMCFLGAIDLGALRMLGLATAYFAPLAVYKPLHQPGVSRPGDTVCMGKEWYRFPSSYFLPNGVKAKFVKSEFSGLLPGEFSEANAGFGLFPGAWLVPPGMNDENREDLGKYVRPNYTTIRYTSSDGFVDKRFSLFFHG